MSLLYRLFQYHRKGSEKSFKSASHLIGLIDPARPDSVEPGIRPIVELLLQWGLTPERACAGHDEDELRLPYVHFHASLDRLAMAYRVHQAMVECRFHGVLWELVAFFPPVTASVVPQRQHGELRFRLSVVETDPAEQSSSSYRCRAISALHACLTQASNPAWIPERVAALGFGNLRMQVQHSERDLPAGNSGSPHFGQFESF